MAEVFSVTMCANDRHPRLVIPYNCPRLDQLTPSADCDTSFAPRGSQCPLPRFCVPCKIRILCPSPLPFPAAWGIWFFFSAPFPCGSRCRPGSCRSDLLHAPIDQYSKIPDRCAQSRTLRIISSPIVSGDLSAKILLCLRIPGVWIRSFADQSFFCFLLGTPHRRWSTRPVCRRLILPDLQICPYL